MENNQYCKKEIVCNKCYNFKNPKQDQIKYFVWKLYK